MRSKPICAYVYINGEIIQSSSANAVFRGDKKKSLLLNPTMTLPDIITTIQSSIVDNDVTPIITALWYCCLVYEFNGEVQYKAIQIIDEEGVLCIVIS